MDRIGNLISHMYNSGFGGVVLLVILAAAALLALGLIANLLIAFVNSVLAGAKGPDSKAAARLRDQREAFRH